MFQGQLRERFHGRFRRRLFGTLLPLRLLQRRETVFVVKTDAVSASRQVLVSAGKGDLVTRAGFGRRFDGRQRLALGGSEDGVQIRFGGAFVLAGHLEADDEDGFGDRRLARSLGSPRRPILNGDLWEFPFI